MANDRKMFYQRQFLKPRLIVFFFFFFRVSTVRLNYMSKSVRSWCACDGSQMTRQESSAFIYSAVKKREKKDGLSYISWFTLRAVVKVSSTKLDPSVDPNPDGAGKEGVSVH